MKLLRNKWLWTVVVIIALASYVSNNWYQLLLIQGESMSPTYHNMQMTILSRNCKHYDYGDVVAFKCEELGTVLVKRIVACPGDELVIDEGTLYVNSRISPLYGRGVFEESGMAEKPVVLGEGQYFVIGDNVAESIDSRYTQVGYVRIDDIMGRVVN